MALVPAALASSLSSSWLVPEGGSYPDTPSQSGDKFAAAVSSWFAAATAGPYPCSTASARRSQLASSATAAIQAGDASLAGTQLAMGLMAYMAGQVFGPGVASPPTAVGAAQSAITGAFSNLDLPLSARANQIATGTYTLAVSTIVVFPPVISPPAPVT
ncbi:MAG TPA: hypothetical protein VF044_00185 [Actinomycetota bacterium]